MSVSTTTPGRSVTPRVSGQIATPVKGGFLPAILDPKQMQSLSDAAYVGEGVTYTSPVPRRLQILRAAILVTLTAWAILSVVTVASIWMTTRTIGRDAAPSVMAAERVRSLLADANGNFANVLLVRDREDGPFMSAFRQDVRDAQTALADAARNVTYADEETGPIVTMMRGVPEYADLVGQARAAIALSTPQGQGVALNAAKAADAVMHFTILPAAASLERVNHGHLSESYAAHRQHAYVLIFGCVALGLASLVLIAVLGLFLARRTHRLIDPFLLAALAAVGVVAVISGYATLHAEWDLKTAKADAFDSIAALSTTQAYANDANAAESFWLLFNGDGAAQTRYEQAFEARAARLMAIPGTEAMTRARAGQSFPGLLGAELSNITFPGEREAAVSAVGTWTDYVWIDRKIRDLVNKGRLVDAVALCVGSNPGQSNYAFQQFDKALAWVIGINRAAFDEAITSAESQVGTGLYGALFAAWLVACAGVWWAVARRLRAYEF